MGFGLFLLGGAEGVAAEAARRLCAFYPGLQVAGTECPSLQRLNQQEETALIARIRRQAGHSLSCPRAAQGRAVDLSAPRRTGRSG